MLKQQITIKYCSTDIAIARSCEDLPSVVIFAQACEDAGSMAIKSILNGSSLKCLIKSMDLRKISHEGDYGGTVDLRKLSHGRMTVEGRSCNFCGGYGVVSVAGMG